MIRRYTEQEIGRLLERFIANSSHGFTKSQAKEKILSVLYEDDETLSESRKNGYRLWRKTEHENIFNRVWAGFVYYNRTAYCICYFHENKWYLERLDGIGEFFRGNQLGSINLPPL